MPAPLAATVQSIGFAGALMRTSMVAFGSVVPSTVMPSEVAVGAEGGVLSIVTATGALTFSTASSANA